MRLSRILQPRRRTIVVETSVTDDPSAELAAELARRMHAEFVCPNYIDRVAAFHGLGPADELTREHFASFDAYRRDAALRAIADESSGNDASSAGSVSRRGSAGGGDSEEPTSS